MLLRPLSRCSRAAVLATLCAAAASAQTPLLDPHGDAAGDAFGAAVAVVPDLDGDGLPDLLVGAPGAPSTTGYARVLSGADGALVLRLLSSGTPDLFGSAVAAAADADSDGVPDLIVGAPGSDAAHGSEVRLFSGGSGAPITVLVSTTWDSLGHALAEAGDLDGDGLPDSVFGAPVLSGAGPGRLVAWSFAAGDQLFEAIGETAGDQFGFSVAGAGDVDLDGVPDLIVGAPAGDYARVLSGADGAPILTLPGEGGDFARAVSAAGDVNADGVPDLAIGVPLFHRVDLLSGTNGALLARYEKVSGEFGSSLALLGDTNDDGVPDLLVGAPADDVGADSAAGTAFVLSGATGQNLFKFTGASAGARLGTGAAAGDVDGDGAPDMLLGAPFDVSPGGQATGAAALYDGHLAGSMVGFGLGCPGSFLITPRLDFYGDPLPGGELTIAVTEALGGAPAALMFGIDQGEAPLANGCILWVEPLVVVVGFVLEGDFPGSGTKSLVGRLPPDVPVGSTFSMQVLISDKGTDGGIAGTSAYLVTVQ